MNFGLSNTCSVKTDSKYVFYIILKFIWLRNPDSLKIQPIDSIILPMSIYNPMKESCVFVSIYCPFNFRPLLEIFHPIVFQLIYCFQPQVSLGHFLLG
ncbi:hypothetical protein HanIR_Chr15g0766191 [Helianthus annuus]|nr:hypothetical protein HanIR_Chr15g0766191 [Helianthus annuus]